MALLGVILTLIILACQKQSVPASDNVETFNNLKDKKVSVVKNLSNNFEGVARVGNLMITYDATNESGVFVSTLKIEDFDRVGKVTNTTFRLNTNAKEYRLLPYLEVNKEAERIKSNYTLEEIENLTSRYELFAKMILSEDVNTGTDLFQSLYFHYAILSTVKRSIQNNEDCNCTPHPGYIVSKTPFFCQEDYLFNTKTFIAAIENAKYQLKGKEVELYNYLKAHSNEREITADKLLSIMQPRADFMKRIEKKIAFNAQKISFSSKTSSDDEEIDSLCDPLPGEGSGLGCCGNYAGCCYYWSVYCLYHDVACLCCDSWWCLWGCKKETWCK